MRKSRLNPISKRRIAQLFTEVEIRRALCERAGGTFYTWTGTFKQPDGSTFQMPICNCVNGICEECHKRIKNLEPHEKIKRSKGGQISLENTIMVCRQCHILEGVTKKNECSE